MEVFCVEPSGAQTFVPAVNVMFLMTEGDRAVSFACLKSK